MSKNKHKATKKQQSNNILLNTFIIFLVVIAICFGIVFYVVFISGSEQHYTNPFNSEISPSAKPTIAIESDSLPIFTTINASSTREPYYSDTDTISYPPSNAFDNDKSTVWTPDIYDTNPWIEISADTAQIVNGIEIENGYSKSENLYYKNNRAKEITVETDTIIYNYTLQDKGNGKTQRLVFTEPLKTTKIKITINSYYEGTEYNDLCITQITPY